MPASSAERLEKCLPYIFAGEGGYTKNSKDPGNWTGGKVGKGVLKGTKYGIAASSFPTLDIANLTMAQAADIYRAKYWTTAGCDTLPDGVDLPIFDSSVNSGPSRGKKFATATAAIADAVARIKAISVQRRSFYQGLSTFKTFGKGWLSRVSTIEAAAVKMALAAVGMSPVAVNTALKGEAAVSQKKVTTGTTVATTTAAGGGGGVVTAATQPGIDWLAIGVSAAAVGLALFVALHFIRAHQERASAFLAEAAKV
ncbi:MULTISPECIES: glycosyl hydrolase 108 family protein [unclassified Methylobacterium]|uniref:glycosyl hydrolase 108 family protein n=1 Tax=unclassified Methylobacterium TaxID=2615210 RepID=UPI00164F3F70|nr:MULTISPECIES: glycosyl hydrolase 108 family protein [unclassified Methylobacterium]